MNGVCDVCGVCDEKLRLTDIDGEQFETCLFCRKPLEDLAAGKPGGLESVRNLYLMDTKGRRNEKCDKRLEGLLSMHGVDMTHKDNSESAQPVKAHVPTQFYGSKATPETMSNGKPLTLEQQVEELKKQVAELTQRMDRFKKRYILSKVLGYILPVVFVVIMLIILLASGALQNIFDYYGTLSDYANM